jgi:hypothetical protein
MLKYNLLLLVILTINCKNTTSKNNPIKVTSQKSNTNIPSIKDSKFIKDIILPDGYTRIAITDSSFAGYLRKIALKQSKTVYLFNGTPKANQEAQYAVLNISVGKKDLQQCADAVMRLRAEYLFAQKNYRSITFWDNERKEYRFKEPYTRQNFDSYLQQVFGMCGSASLEIQLHSKKDLQKIAIGDVFIKGGFPGHAVIVVDVAENNYGEKIFMLAQSYMPAQDIHILKNPNNKELNPWYAVNEIDQFLVTPEYIFTDYQLRTW